MAMIVSDDEVYDCYNEIAPDFTIFCNLCLRLNLQGSKLRLRKFWKWKHYIYTFILTLRSFNNLYLEPQTKLCFINVCSIGNTTPLWPETNLYIFEFNQLLILYNHGNCLHNVRYGETSLIKIQPRLLQKSKHFLHHLLNSVMNFSSDDGQIF